MGDSAQLRAVKERVKKTEAKQEELETKINNNVVNIYEDISAVREVIIKNLKYENRSLRARLSTLEMRVAQIERTVNNNNQNSRKNNIEISGIPISVPHTDLENSC